MGKEETYKGLLWGNLRKIHQLEYPDVNGMIILS